MSAEIIKFPRAMRERRARDETPEEREAKFIRYVECLSAEDIDELYTYALGLLVRQECETREAVSPGSIAADVPAR